MACFSMARFGRAYSGKRAPAAMYQCAGEHHASTGRHHHADGFGLQARIRRRAATALGKRIEVLALCLAPHMTAGEDIGGTVARSECIDRHNRRERNHRTRMRDVVKRIITVKRLRRLARIDADRLRCGQQKIGQQETLAQRQDARIKHDVPHHPRPCHQRVHALGAGAFKIVAPGVRIKDFQDFFLGAQGALKPYIAAGRFKTFEGNTDLVPGIKAQITHGHTPGHTFYVAESKGQKMVFWGDLMHVAAVQFENPGVTIQFDTDSKAAAAQRKRAYAEAAKQGYLVGVAHISFPGIGRLRAAGTGYTWVPVNYSAVK